MAQVVKSDKIDQEPDVPAPAPVPVKQPVSIKALPRNNTSTGGGFFSIYKKSQGYWTRMGTAITAAVIGAFVAYNLYEYLEAYLNLNIAQSADVQAVERFHQHLAMGISLGFLAVYALVGWYLMNQPRNVEFLIATDVEMKKVNWTSRRELLGSTKVVIGFMFLTAIFLFVIDMLFRFLMQLIHVLNWGAPF